MSSDAEPPSLRDQPIQFVCPSCRLHLLSGAAHIDSVEMFHKVALWADFWTGEIRLLCPYCLGATDVLPPRLVELLRRRYGLDAPAPTETRR